MATKLASKAKAAASKGTLLNAGGKVGASAAKGPFAPGVPKTVKEGERAVAASYPFITLSPTAYYDPTRSLDPGTSYKDYLKYGKPVAQLQGELSDEWLPRLANDEARAAGQRASKETAIVEQQGLRHYNATLNNAPILKAAHDNLLGLINESSSTTGEKSRLYGELETQAYDDLLLKGQLTPQEERLSQQAARAAFSARGLANSSPSAVAEVLNRDEFANARQGTRRAFATQVEGLRQNQEATDRSFSLSALGAAQWFDPFTRVFGAYSKPGSNVDSALSVAGSVRPFVEQATALQAQNFANANSLSLNRNAQTLQEELAARQDDLGLLMQSNDLDFKRWETELNAQLMREQMASNRSAGIAGGALGAIGQIGGAIF